MSEVLTVLPNQNIGNTFFSDEDSLESEEEEEEEEVFEIENEFGLSSRDQNVLLMTVNGLGTQVETQKGELVYKPDEECTEFLRDLLRFLRQEDAAHPSVTLQLNKWNIIESDLLPLLSAIRNRKRDHPLIFTTLKLLANLTVPMARNSEYHTKEHIEFLQTAKESFLARKEVTSVVFAGYLAAIAGKEGPTQFDHDFIELILTLVRNLLVVPDLASNRLASGSDNRTHMQDDFILFLHKAKVIDLLVFFLQEGKIYERHRFIILEILRWILDRDTPEGIWNWYTSTTQAIAKNVGNELRGQRSDEGGSGETGLTMSLSSTNTPVSLIFNDHNYKEHNMEKENMPEDEDIEHSVVRAVMEGRGGEVRAAVMDNELKSIMEAEKNKVMREKLLRPARHPRFGGTFAASGHTGLLKIFNQSASEVSDRSIGRALQAARNPVPRSKGLRLKATQQEPNVRSSLSVKLALKEMADAILQADVFSEFMSEIYNALHDQSNRDVLASDAEHFLFLTGFFVGYQHERQVVSGNISQEYDVSPVASSMSHSVFYMVAKKMKTYNAEKNWSGLGITVRTLKYMVRMVTNMYEHADTAVPAAKLINNMIHKMDKFLIIVIRLIAAFMSSKHVNSYLIDLVECAHLLMRLTEKYCARHRGHVFTRRKKISRGGHNVEFFSESTLTVREEEAENRYTEDNKKWEDVRLDWDAVIKRFASKNVIKAYCHVLEGYESNTTDTNYHIAKLFKRLAVDKAEECCAVFYQLCVLRLFERILGDPVVVRSSPKYRAIVNVITKITKDFFKFVNVKPSVLLEIMFWKNKSDLLLLSAHSAQVNRKRTKSDEEQEAFIDDGDHLHTYSSEDDEHWTDPSSDDDGGDDDNDDGSDDNHDSYIEPHPQPAIVSYHIKPAGSSQEKKLRRMARRKRRRVARKRRGGRKSISHHTENYSSNLNDKEYGKDMENGQEEKEKDDIHGSLIKYSAQETDSREDMEREEVVEESVGEKIKEGEVLLEEKVSERSISPSSKRRTRRRLKRLKKKSSDMEKTNMDVLHDIFMDNREQEKEEEEEEEEIM